MVAGVIPGRGKKSNGILQTVKQFSRQLQIK
jgi:hypothetical protein